MLTIECQRTIAAQIIEQEADYVLANAMSRCGSISIWRTTTLPGSGVVRGETTEIIGLTDFGADAVAAFLRRCEPPPA